MARSKWSRLTGQLYHNRDSGAIELRSGKGGWHRSRLGNIKGTRTHKAIVDSYGKKGGKTIRKRASLQIIKSIRYKRRK